MTLMNKLLDYYTVTAERETGFWIGIPVATGGVVERNDWLKMMEDDPDHFHLVKLTGEEVTQYSLADDDVIERAVFVIWSDEQLQ